MSAWNYRILNSGDRWWIGEVYYNHGGRPVAYIDKSGVLDDWTSQEELVSTYRLVGFAMEKPVLRVGRDGSLTEVS